MARTTRQIEQAISADIEAQDATLDTVKGPIPDIFIRPQASQIRGVELRIDDLNRRYSLDYVRTTNTAALELYGSNHGLRKSPGRPSRGYVYFYTFTRLNPGDSLKLPAGTVVSTSDTTVSYQTTVDAVIIGDSMSSYYNVSKRRYELRVPVESLGTGEAFDIPAGRIRTIRSGAPGLDGVENREPIRGSREEQDNESFGLQIQAKFNGLGLGSGDGLRQLILTNDTSRITDARVVFSSNQALFRRRTRRAAWDVYIIGEEAEAAEANFLGNGIKREFVLPLQPVVAISSVLINNISIPYSLVRDTSDATKLSSRSTDKVVFASAPIITDMIEISYTYDRLIQETQAYVDQKQINLYDSDTLVRQAFKVNVAVNVSIQVLSSFDASQAVVDTLAVITDFFSIDGFIEILYPENLRTRIASEVGGISGVKIVGFNRLDTGTLPVDAIEFAANEYPVLSTDNVLITPRR